MTGSSCSLHAYRQLAIIQEFSNKMMHISANYLIGLTTLCAVLIGQSLRTASADETKCSGTFIYRPRDKPVPCRDICPPNKTTDNNLRFCWVNCREFMRCLLSLKPNGDEVIETLESSVTADCLPTYFYYIRRREYIPCRNVCTVTTSSSFCAANCPGFSKCMTSSTSTLSSRETTTTTTTTATAAALGTSDAATVGPQPVIVVLFVMFGVLCFVLLVVVVLLLVCYRRIHNNKQGCFPRQATDDSKVRIGAIQPTEYTDRAYESLNSTLVKLVDGAA